MYTLLYTLLCKTTNMALKRFYIFQEAKKLILEDGSPSDDDSDVEPDSDSSNGIYVPDSDNRILVTTLMTVITQMQSN